VTGQSPAPRPVTQVAVGVLVRDDGAVLLADRPAGKPYAGYWEFPGGKIESGESVAQALARELAEELGVSVRDSLPWVTMEYDYPHAYVRLHFRRILAWTGVLRAVEGQRLQFLSPGEMPPQPLLPAAIPAMRWIQLPAVTGCSPQTCRSAGESVAWMENVVGRGLRQIIWHEPLLDAAERGAALLSCTNLAATYGVHFLVDVRSLSLDSLLSGSQPGDAGPGRYLDTPTLRAATVRPEAAWLGAAVETAADLEHAAALGCDFAVLDAGGVNLDPSQWESMSRLCGDTPLPIYLAAGTGLANLQKANRAGAHGLAIRP